MLCASPSSCNWLNSTCNWLALSLRYLCAGVVRVVRHTLAKGFMSETEQGTAVIMQSGSVD